MVGGNCIRCVGGKALAVGLDGLPVLFAKLCFAGGMIMFFAPGCYLLLLGAEFFVRMGCVGGASGEQDEDGLHEEQAADGFHDFGGRGRISKMMNDFVKPKDQRLCKVSAEQKVKPSALLFLCRTVANLMQRIAKLA